MITRLYLDNCFKHFDRTFDFTTGLTGIIGQNEAGKSLIVEMIRYALFGSKALRGKADDYKKLHVELDFHVGGLDYTVVRKGSKVTLSGGREVSGTSPVNEAIQSILGYGLDVFDVANACNQGNVEALSSMTPAARRQMVDKTIGLNVLDDLIAYCSNEGNAHRRTSQALQTRLVEPVPPAEPEGYQPSTTFRLQDLEQKVAELNQIRGRVANAPAEPVEPPPCPVSDDVEAYQKNRQQVLDRNARSERLLASLPAEEVTLEEILEAEALHDLRKRAKARDRLLAEGHLCCPSCNHSWPVAGEALKAFDDVPAVIPTPKLSEVQCREHRSRLGNDARRAEIVLEPVPEDRSDQLRIVQQHRAQVAAYEMAREAFDAYHSGLDQALARLEELKDSENQLREQRIAYQSALRYEQDMTRFDQDMKRFHLDQTTMQDHAAKSEEYLKARDILQALKTSVKSHLLPSLNKVASVLIAQMTGGERYKVEVSDDFEITIDDQAIGTLSGSGKAVANLAIRIALGQILTNRTFSVFLADEVDAAMDEDRAGHTADALRRLTEMVKQVVLVTHKRPATDHIFELRKT